MSFTILAALLLEACNEKEDTADTAPTQDTTDTVDTSDTVDTVDTASPCDDDSCMDDIRIDPNNAAIVYLDDGASLQCARDYLANLGAGVDGAQGTIYLSGGTYTKGMTLQGDDVISLIADTTTTSTLYGSNDGGAFITLEAGAELYVDGQGYLLFGGSRNDTGIRAEDATVEISATDFDNLATAVDVSGGVLSVDDSILSQIHVDGIVASLGAEVQIASLIQKEGMITTSLDHAVLADGAHSVIIQESNFADIITNLPAVSVVSDYLAIVGNIVANVDSSDVALYVDSGDYVPDELAFYPYSVVANNLFTDSQTGYAGTVSLNTTDRLYANNNQVQNCFPADGSSETVVDATNAAHPGEGHITMAQWLIVDNDSVGCPITTTEDGNVDVRYTDMWNNGQGDTACAPDTDIDDSNTSADPLRQGGVVYNPIGTSPVCDIDAARLSEESSCWYAGDDDALCVDADAPTSETRGSITVFGGSLSPYIEGAASLFTAVFCN